MKTQIIFRTILVAAALFASINNNNGSFMQTITVSGYNQKINTSMPHSKEEDKTSSQNNNAIKDDSLPFVPQNDDCPDYDCFDFRHHELRSFWRCIANKIFAILYHIIILSPILIEVLKQLFPSAS